MRRLLSASLLALALSCSHTAPAPAPTPSRHAPVAFEERMGRPFPYPLVHATVAGQPFALIVDTGATDHVLSASLVAKLGLKLAAQTEQGSTHDGRAITGRVVADPQLVVDTWGPVEGAPVYAVDLPPVFEQLGIAGILSPQRLPGPGQAVVLDLLRGEVAALPEAEAAARIPADALRLTAAPTAACSASGGGTKYKVPAKVHGIDAQLEVDTGSGQTDLFIRAAAARALAASASDGGSSYQAGGSMTTQVVPAAEMQVGEVRLTHDVDLVEGKNPDTSCDYDGMAGIDLLRRCVLVLGPTAFTGGCAR